MKESRLHQNHLGPIGWLWAGRYKLERYLFTLHRVTGLALLLVFLTYLTVITISQVQGRDIWLSTLLLVHSRWFSIVVVLFVFHGLNGLRLSLQELGFTLGKPAPPVYPYQDSLRQKRPLTAALVAVVVLLALVSLFVFFVVGVW